MAQKYKIVKETDNWTQYAYDPPQYAEDSYMSRYNTFKHNKFFCIGGPHDGLYKTAVDVRDSGYFPFNRAAGGRQCGHSQVWIHDETLHQQD